MLYVQRTRALLEQMAQEGVDTVLLSVGADLPYLTGYEAIPLERLSMLVVDATGCTLLVPELEAPRVEPEEFEIVAWQETTNPLDVVAEMCPPNGSIAIGDQTWSVFLIGLVERLANARFRSATPLLRPLRARKDAEEIRLLAAAAETVDRVSARLPSLRFQGRRERVVAREITDMMIEEGHDQGQFWIVASGPNSASPHHEPNDRIIEAGDVVVVDFGGRQAGYCSDTTRTFAVGQPTAEQIRVHATVLEAQQQALAACRPGATAESIDDVARRVIAEAGFGEYFIHRTGHGIGLETHEHPYLVEGNDEILEPGMCFSIEPGIYLPGRFGVRIEDIVVMTESGGRPLNNSDRSLRVVG
ncbi:MAG: aminopeptidase P family protein [Actinobacteria bacterium]|nr:aminopeptidase P family protein [Actinomycetota bacterium]